MDILIPPARPSGLTVHPYVRPSVRPSDLPYGQRRGDRAPVIAFQHQITLALSRFAEVHTYGTPRRKAGEGGTMNVESVEFRWSVGIRSGPAARMKHPWDLEEDLGTVCP